MSDTSIIDDKKKQQSPDQKKEFYNFFIGIFTRLIIIGILVLIGALCLYSGKVAQTNILPTCLSFAPYTKTPAPIKQIPVDINIFKTEKGTWSTKLDFPLDENFKTINNTLGVFQNLANGPNSNVFKLYIAKTLQQIIACNFSVVNTVNNFMNSMLSETWFILLAPYILFFTTIATSVINTFYMFLLWFYNIYLLFSEKTTDNAGNTTWKDGEMWGMFNWSWSLMYIFAFTILFFTVGMGFVIPVTAFFVSLFCAVFPLFMKSKNAETGKAYGLSETIKNVFKYKLNIIMILLSLYVILSANSNFGGYAAFVAILSCVILYFFSSVYHPYMPKATDHATFGLGDYVQAEKVCTPLAAINRESTMFEKIGKLFGGAKRWKK